MNTPNKSLWVSRQGFKLGQGMLGMHGGATGSVKQNVHDGDTVAVRLVHDLSFRFFGMDSPEVSFEFPGTGGKFVSIGNERWDHFFTSGQWREGLDHFHPGLLADLKARIGDGVGVAANHAKLADDAQGILETAMLADLALSGKSKDDFRLFFAFAHEFLDGYGRLLAYLHPSADNFENGEYPKGVEKSYNERQLAQGGGIPYFIWPNVQPFLRGRPFAQENVNPEGFWEMMRSRASKLNSARKAVAQAREMNLGIFDANEPLRVMPFELRFLSRKKAPDRYFIDLS
ncbi:MAG: hypothetical protein IT269_01325, partial [Saprospiraceae bacterium]|nr:hypothetical protein [Saprospiraceae bacterium]